MTQRTTKSRKLLTRSQKRKASELAGSYQIVVRRSEEDECYLATVPAIRGCATHGDTPEAALRNGLEVLEMWLEDAIRDGDHIPAPLHAYSGRLSLRMPISLHQRVAAAAERDGVSINHWIVVSLARSA